jgi:site-specific DNA-methyltransferase (adenine-specific)
MKLLNGNNLELLKTLEDNSVDSVITDPPYGLSFMNKKWDYDVPSVEFWNEVYRVLKPGGHILSFGGTRTYHRMVVNIEDAGFEIRDQIQWIYGSGFPKSLNIGKAVDKLEGNSQYEGWGTGLKPANEPICLARKPLSEKSVALNVLKWRTGGINIDGSRVGYVDENDKLNAIPQGRITTKSAKNGIGKAVGGINDYEINKENYIQYEGRFPANIIFDEEAAKLLDEQSNNTSRFFYQTKVSKAERNIGIETNNHPTVKPINLMTYLCRLITPKGGVVLDPYMGSGSSGISALLEGFDFIGMEMDEDYFKIAEGRINNYEQYKKFIK